MILDGAGEKAKIEDRKSRVASPLRLAQTRFLDKVPGIEKMSLMNGLLRRDVACHQKTHLHRYICYLMIQIYSCKSGDLLAR